MVMHAMDVPSGQAPASFAEWLNEAITRRGATIRQVAEYSGVSASAISSLARGKGRPTMETCYRLAEYFKVDAAMVLTLAGYRLPEEVDRAVRRATDELCRRIRQLSPEQRDDLWTLLDAMESIRRRRREREKRGEG